MKITILTQHYAPETVGTARRAQLLAEYFSEHDHDVTVVCGVPNHPSMVDLRENELKMDLQHQHIRTVRLNVYSKRPFSNKNGKFPANSEPSFLLRDRMARIRTYVSWFTRCVLHEIVFRQPCDVLIAISPLPTGIVGAISAAKNGVPLIFDVQDIWPDGVIRAGFLQTPLWIRGLSALERHLYKTCSALVVLSEGFSKQLIKNGAPREKIQCITNAVAIATVSDESRVRMRHQLGLRDDDCAVIYTGNLGFVQDLDILLEAAACLRHMASFKFIVVGRGMDETRLQQVAAERGLTAVKFLGHKPHGEIAHFLAAADICFLTLRKNRYTPGTIPSKLYEYLASERPIVSVVEGDTEAVLMEAGAGITASPTDPTQLAETFLTLGNSPDERRRMGKAGKYFVQQNATAEIIGKQYENLIQRIIRRDRERSEMDDPGAQG